MCSHAHVNNWIMVHFQPRTHYYYYYYYKRWCLKWRYHAQTLQGHLTNTKTVTCWQWRGSDISILAKGCPEQYCFQLMSKGRQWPSISDERRQRVPSTGSRNWKRTVFQSPSSRSWNDQRRRVDVSQATAGTTAGCQMQGFGEVPWRCTMKASEGQNTEPKLYPLRNSQPVEFTE